MRILIADDDPISRGILDLALRRWGYQNIVIAEDGNKAWEILDSEEKPDIALLDWVMPGRTGVELCKLLRERQNPHYTYVILVTGKSERRDHIEGLNSGVDEYLTKPLVIQEFQARIHNAARVVASHRELEKLNGQLAQTKLELERRVVERTNQLAEAKELALNASKLKSEFLANMSHEIRTPLNGVVSTIELLLESALSEEQRQDAETIRDCATTLRLLISDILDFSKIEAGKLVLDNSTFRLSDLVRHAVAPFEANAKRNKTEIKVLLNEIGGQRFRGDPLRIQQIITNLLANACKFSEQGGQVEIELSSTLLHDTIYNLNFLIRDNGIGIPQSKQSELFQDFSQADGSITRRFGGTGLGLAICRRLTEMMGGTIHFSSVEGVGSTFRIKIPCELLSTSEAEQTPFLENIKKRAGRVLVADDNVVNRRSIRRKLTRWGYTVIEASDAVEALRELRRQEFNLVLMDVQMPCMSGIELVRHLRKIDTPNKQVPVVAVTANAFTEDVLACHEAGMNAHISKPINFELLLKTMDELAEGSVESIKEPL